MALILMNVLLQYVILKTLIPCILSCIGTGNIMTIYRELRVSGGHGRICLW